MDTILGVLTVSAVFIIGGLATVVLLALARLASWIVGERP